MEFVHLLLEEFSLDQLPRGMISGPFYLVRNFRIPSKGNQLFPGWFTCICTCTNVSVQVHFFNGECEHVRTCFSSSEHFLFMVFLGFPLGIPTISVLGYYFISE